MKLMIKIFFLPEIVSDDICNSTQCSVISGTILGLIDHELQTCQVSNLNQIVRILKLHTFTFVNFFLTQMIMIKIYQWEIHIFRVQNSGVKV